MPNENTIEVSIIIPVLTGHENLKYLLSSIGRQTLLPSEIVIVDSCLHTEVKELIDDIHFEIPINYYRTGDRIFPGKARNIGASIAKCEYIAFLDCRTVPFDDWLRHYSQVIKEQDADVVTGSTKVLARSKFQWYLRAASYGTNCHDTLPGTLMKKQLFDSTGGFVEYLRMAEDIEWFKRLKGNEIKFVSITTPFIKYDGLPESLFGTWLKYLKSGYYTSFVLENFKNLIASLTLISAALIIPRWNFLIAGWDTNALYIPNVTKIFFLVLVSLLLIWRLVYFLMPRALPDNIFVLFTKLAILGTVTYSISTWNASMALWVEDAVLYIPHITKIYFGLLLVSVFIYRGLIKPMMNGVSSKELIPKKLFVVGILGLSLDIWKIPGTIVGSVVGRVRQLMSSFDTSPGK